jgi:hypothetical protein
VPALLDGVSHLVVIGLWGVADLGWLRSLPPGLVHAGGTTA